MRLFTFGRAKRKLGHADTNDQDVSVEVGEGRCICVLDVTSSLIQVIHITLHVRGSDLFTIYQATSA